MSGPKKLSGYSKTDQGDAGAFLPWFLNSLHMALGGTKKKTSSIVYKWVMIDKSLKTSCYIVKPSKVTKTKPHPLTCVQVGGD